MRVLAAVLLLLLVPSATATYDADDHPDPGVSPSLQFFPTPDEVTAAVEKFRGHPWFQIHDLGTSKEGRPLRLVEVADPQSPINRSDRVVTFIFTQQHGNEPAGTPAALGLLQEIAAGGTIAQALENQILLVLPMANPDGAAASQRENAMGRDINRDHIALETPEARLLHRVLNDWDVHVAMDHHEYGGLGFGNPSPVRLYDYDLTTLFPNHGNVGQTTSAWSQKLMYDGIWPRAAAAGYTANEYGEQTVAGVPVQQVAGGPDPGIMRNHIGLHHIAGLLVETRVDAHPNPFHDAERRAALHSLVMEATLQFVYQHASDFRAAKATERAAATATPAHEYVEGDVRAPLADAYLTLTSLDDVFNLHGIPLSGRATAKEWTYNLDHELRAHAAAALHPQSSRRLVEDARPVDLVTFATPQAQPSPAAETSAPSAVAALSIVAIGLSVLAAGRRRSH